MGKRAVDSGGNFARGLELFNGGQFFACHEAWEASWKRSDGLDRQFVQGLIQAAAAILHVERGNLNGAASTWRKARARLDPLADDYGAIALGELRAALARFFAIALGGGDLPPRPQIRRLALRSDL
ncbi:MAG TPA: DUF309 domain-containing protein [Candidatus Binataceae bacterium]|nr:DUF309 domain-containing protein [Candidatus Binataceae bacterium]